MKVKETEFVVQFKDEQGHWQKAASFDYKRDAFARRDELKVIERHVRVLKSTVTFEDTVVG